MERGDVIMITTVALNGLAEYFRSRVASVILNDHVLISTFVLVRVVDDLYQLEFNVTEAVSEIRRIRLMDVNGATLADFKMEIPVGTNVRFRVDIRFNNRKR